jgi:acetylornithine deacetylase/succinyl-diaminopimelate desuccinylase-like protein
MTIDPFAGAVRDGRLYGRGASDTKGTMAAMLWALRELGPTRVSRLNCEVWFAGLAGEEWAQHGSKDFGRRYGGLVAFALVGEPTGCQAVVKTKGAAWPQLIATGRAAHASRPELGDNAIAKMAHALHGIDSEFRELLKNAPWTDPLLGHSTISLGTVQGGERGNIVADRCTATLDLRMTPAFYNDGGVELLRRFLDRGGYQVALEAPPPSPPLDTPADHPYVRVLESLGATPAGAPWFCDASWLAAAGIPAAAAGPGSIEQAHTADEWISLADLEHGATFYRSFLERC